MWRLSSLVVLVLVVVLVLDRFGVTQRVIPFPDAVQIRIKPLDQLRLHRDNAL